MGWFGPNGNCGCCGPEGCECLPCVSTGENEFTVGVASRNPGTIRFVFTDLGTTSLDGSIIVRGSFAPSWGTYNMYWLKFTDLSALEDTYTINRPGTGTCNQALEFKGNKVVTAELYASIDRDLNNCPTSQTKIADIDVTGSVSLTYSVYQDLVDGVFKTGLTWDWDYDATYTTPTGVDVFFSGVLSAFTLQMECVGGQLENKYASGNDDVPDPYGTCGLDNDLGYRVDVTITEGVIECCPTCEDGEVPSSIQLTLSGWPSDLYVYSRCYTSLDTQPSCDGPIAMPVNPGLLIERFKISGISSFLNAVFSTSNAFGVGSGGYCTRLSDVISTELSGKSQLAYQQIFPSPTVLCPTTFEDCADETFEVQLQFTSHNYTVTIIRQSTGQQVFGFLGVMLPNNYCIERTGTHNVETNYPLVSSTPGSPCSSSNFNGCGTFNDFDVTWTLTPVFV